jgi:aspartate/methionine/tyrosine aminotransferase
MSLAEAVRAAAVPPFHAMAMSRLASERQAAGHQVLHLEVGQPATGAPAAARRAVIEALERGGPLGYTDAPGLTSLRAGIARLYRDWHQVEVDPHDVMVVAGASAGFTLSFAASFDAGDRVGILEPGYPCYRNTLIALGIEPVAIPVGPATRWAPTAEQLDAAGHLDGLIIASPSNPTGTVLEPAAVAAVVAWCATHGVQLIADEIYHGIVYDKPATSVLGSTRDAIVINSFSKYFSMTGWRLGWMVVPQHLTAAVERLQQNLYICAPHVSQVAGLAALGCRPELDSHVARYRANRAVLLAGLRGAGIDHVAQADGAFYVYADVHHLTDAIDGDAMTLCRRWLHELGVAATPGIDFDLARGNHFVRFSYAGAERDLVSACERLAEWAP